MGYHPELPVDLRAEALSMAARIVARGESLGLSVCIAPAVHPGQKLRLIIQWQACDLKPEIEDFRQRLDRRSVEVMPEEWQAALLEALAIPHPIDDIPTNPIAVHVMPPYAANQNASP